MTGESIIDMMKELGLSKSESSMLLSLIDKPDGETVDDLLSLSPGSSEVTKEALINLLEKRLVKIVSNKLEAEDPKLFLQRLQESKKLELSRNLEFFNSTTSKLLSIIEPRYWEARLGIRPEELLEPLASLEEMETKTMRTLRNSTKRVSIIAETFGWFDRMHEAIREANERKVDFRLLVMAKDPQTLRRAGEMKKMGAVVKRPLQEWYPVRGTLADDKEVLFLIWASPNAQRPSYFRPHYSTNPGMIRIFADAFEKWWTEATSL